MNSKFYEENKKMLKDSEMRKSFNNLSYENQFRPLTFDNVSDQFHLTKIIIQKRKIKNLV